MRNAILAVVLMAMGVAWQVPSGIVIDARNKQVGRLSGPNGEQVLFQAVGKKFIACMDTGGFTVFATAFFETPNCTGQAYYQALSLDPTNTGQLAISCGQMAVGRTGGTLVYPDDTQTAQVQIQSLGIIDSNMDVFGCGSTGFTDLMDPYVSVPIPTFKPPFRLQ